LRHVVSQAKDARIDWLLFYHRRRLHATPGYLGPLAFAKKRLADKDLPKKQGSPHRRSAKGDPNRGQGHFPFLFAFLSRRRLVAALWICIALGPVLRTLLTYWFDHLSCDDLKAVSVY
jgi:hypothetical protein